MKKSIFTFFFFLLLFQNASGGDYIIGEGDVLHVSVWGVDKLNLSVKVRPDGKMTVPALGDIIAAGYTPKELQDKLAEKLKNIVANPVVTIIVVEITNSKVYLFGGGIKPGIYDLNRRTTLLQLLCQIGDVKKADLKNAYILRKGTKVKEDFYNLFINGDITGDILIETDDVIFIPESTERNVYIVGAVNTPKFIEYRDGLTILEVILEAGGFTKFAKQNDTLVLRKEGEKEVSIPVKLKNLIQDGDLSQNVKLKAGDYIIIKEGLF